MDKVERRYLTIDLPCAGALLSGASRGTSYRLAENGEIEVLKLGRRKVVSVAWLESKVGVERGELDGLIDDWYSKQNAYKSRPAS